VRRLGALLALFLALPAAAAPRVLLAPYSGVITPVSNEFMRGAIARAEKEKFAAVVLQIDTPGGLVSSMRETVKAQMGARIPVIVYVHPAGGRAASAGVFITMAGHVAAMSPGTNIGAAHPVSIGMPGVGGKKKESGGEDKVMAEKAVNDLAAYLKSIAQERGRNTEWAFAAVSKSTSIPATEALALGVVDYVAESLPDLLTQVDGKKLDGFGALNVKDAVIVRHEMTTRQKLLAAIADPNIAMILMTIGMGGLFIELYNPGLMFPGIAGALSLILAFYSFETLSASYAGVLLMFAGMVLLILEIKVTSYGLLTLGGIGAILMGVLMLFQQPLGGLSVSWSVIASMIGGILALAALIGYVVYTTYRRRIATGRQGMVGLKGTAISAIDPSGRVRVQGEIWQAVSAQSVAEGEAIVVLAVDGMRLKIKKK
jgi:membrane-bound serine protease (ClpP class)